jgi:hypothetical protein
VAISSFLTNYAKVGFHTGVLCLWSSTTASYYITLVSNGYVPDEDHNFASAFSGNELSSTSFTAGYSGTMRISLTGRVVNSNATSNQAEFQAATVVWSGISAGTAHAFVVIQQSGSDALSPIIVYNSLGGFPITTNATNLTISFTSAGVFALQTPAT